MLCIIVSTEETHPNIPASTILSPAVTVELSAV